MFTSTEIKLLTELVNINNKLLQERLDNKTIQQNQVDSILKALALIVPPGQATKLILTITGNGLSQVKQGDGTMATQMTDQGNGTATLTAVDAVGNPTTPSFDAAPTWASSDTTVLAVTAAADGLSAAIANAVPPKLGTATISVDAKEAGVDLAGTADVTVVSGPPASVTVAVTLIAAAKRTDLGSNQASSRADQRK
jgi:hypothetical protein